MGMVHPGLLCWRSDVEHGDLSMNVDELADLLQLSPAGRELLRAQVKLYAFDKSGPVIHKGQTVAGAYVVLEGQLRVYTYSAQGNEATLYFLRPGETCVLTLNSLFNDFRYPAWVDADANSRVAMIPGDLFRSLFAGETEVRNMTVQSLSTLVFRLMDGLEEVQTCNLEQRLSRFILNHASADGVIRIKQQELAGHLGSTREVIARLIQNFKSKEMIATGRGYIRILDEASLASLVTPADAVWPD